MKSTFDRLAERRAHLVAKRDNASAEGAHDVAEAWQHHLAGFDEAARAWIEGLPIDDQDVHIKVRSVHVLRNGMGIKTFGQLLLFTRGEIIHATGQRHTVRDVDDRLGRIGVCLSTTGD